MADAPTANPPEGDSKRTYPRLTQSAYQARTTTRRERWWFSDGLWLDQGQTGDVVGFAWTHWLADRGVQVSGADLDQDYATELQREAQRAGGSRVGPDSGARIDAAARVLQMRGLVERCYTFRGADAIVNALLESGPVIAGVTWRTEMFDTVVIDGWTLTRYNPNGSAAGGYATLLNGITLDLTIDGVTGFVRLKNTWGQRWGDNGQALISIADLTALIQLETTLFPVPAAAVLRSGVSQDVGIEGTAPVQAASIPEAAAGTEAAAGPQAPAEPAKVRFRQSSITGDQSTRQDTLGAAAYAEAIARGIQHPETRAPLTIGIKAPWGAGKTSLMRMIRDRLEWPGRDWGSNGSAAPPGELPRIKLTPDAARLVAASSPKAPVRDADDLSDVTNQGVLRKLRQNGGAGSGARDEPDDGDKKLKAVPGRAAGSDAVIPPQDDPRWRPTVWFNPWMYQTGDQVWAGLANEIINQVTERMTRIEREHFWLHLNRRRIDEQAVRRKIYSLILERLLPYAIFGLVLLAGGIVLLATGQTGWLGRAFTLAGPAAVLAGGGLAAWQTLSSRVGGGLSGIVQPAVTAQRFAAGELSGSYAELVASPDYRANSGYLYLVQTDVKRVLNLVATDDRPLVIFVDDLDRCSPSTVVQVIEAINIFLAGDFTNCIFVIAMEPEMVAAHIEAAYSDLVAKLVQTSGRAASVTGLGWRFLEKIVQLPLVLPAMEPGTSKTFIASLFPPQSATDGVPGQGSAPAGGPPADAVLAGQAASEALATASLSEAISIAGQVRPDQPESEKVRDAVERGLTADDPDVREAIAYASQCLNRNPREIKRFVNLFRFYAMIYAERVLANLPAPGKLEEVAKLAVLGIRWPSLLGALAQTVGDDDQGTVFELLERPATSEGEAALKGALTSAGLSEAMVECLLTTPDLAVFLRAEPTVGPGVRGYL